MKTEAAIRRASQQARNAMRELDAAGVAELLELYGQAAEQVRGAIAAAQGADGLVARERLQGLLRQVEAVMADLGRRYLELLDARLADAAALGVRPYTAQGVAAVGGGGTAQAVLDSAAAMRVSQEAVRFVQTFTAADGLRLSDRVWRLELGAKEALQRAISNAVVQGWSASRAAAELAYAGQAVPPELARQITQARGPGLVRMADLLMTGANGNGAEVWKAERVMRTEINRAHGEAYMASAEQTPGFAGFKFLLSPMHPEPDICFVKGTPITTRRGSVPIELVQEGDEVLTHRGRWRPVIRLYRSASGPRGFVRLCSPAGHSHIQPVVMTPNHPVLTPQGWTAAGDLQTGSAVVCLAPATAERLARCGAGAGGTASRGSGETASADAAQRSGPARCGAHAGPAGCTARTAGADDPLPTGLPRSGAATPRPCGCRPTTLDCSARCAAPTATAETVPSGKTGRGGEGRSSGCQRPCEGHTPCSNTSPPSGSSETRTAYRMWRRALAWLHALWRSTQPSNTPAALCAFATPGPGTADRTAGMSALPVLPWPARRTGGCKTAWWPFSGHAPIGQGWGAALGRSVRMVWAWTWAHPIAFSAMHPTIEDLPATGETVFNLEVAEDHSYVAGGWVVHNCDLLAEQNLYGLGKGVYPSREKTPWPAHPNTLSFLQIVFKDEVTDADKAGKETELQALQRMAPELRAGVLGQTKAEYFDAGLIKSKGMIRATASAVTARLKRQGVV